MSTKTMSDAELAELVEHEVPCGGIGNRHCRRSCDQAAVLRLHDHDCVESSHEYCFKCMTCWQVWFTHVATRLATQGFIKCTHCKRRFYSVESFADYRPF